MAGTACRGRGANQPPPSVPPTELILRRGYARTGEMSPFPYGRASRSRPWPRVCA